MEAAKDEVLERLPFDEPLARVHNLREKNMVRTARDEILKGLKSAAVGEISPRPHMPALNELSYDTVQLIDKFTENLVAQTGIVYRVNDYEAVLSKLGEIARQEGLKRAMASTDEVVAQLDLPAWGRAHGVAITTHRDFKDRDSFKEAVFNEAEAGISAADYAIAESGTLALIHKRNQARLISLAPILHIAIVPVERIVGVYEQVVRDVYGRGKRPGQLTFITGPSMTADIQATPFRGMHGPRKLIVIVVGAGHARPERA